MNSRNAGRCNGVGVPGIHVCVYYMCLLCTYIFVIHSIILIIYIYVILYVCVAVRSGYAAGG